MAGFIPQELLDDILGRTDIVELIASYIPLKRAGRNFRAVCPFHHEKTPSFMVSPDRQIYHCFGCNCGGNAFNFLMQYERLEFPEAVETLAKKAGVALPQSRKEEPKFAGFITQLYKVNELAALFYESNITGAPAQAAKSYLLGRGIREDTIKLFKLGYAQDQWNTLINNLRAKGLSLSLMEKAGLILNKEGGGYYDRFRGRVIFPIFDIKSRPLAFGARILTQPSPLKNAHHLSVSAKYINSPETPIYTKGKHLYGLNFAKDAIREKDFIVVVEGYLDCMIPYQEGLRNIVASLGTALTDEQIRLIKRHTHNVVMVYDSDDAGQMATLRSLDMFVEEGMQVRVVSLPKGYDPDSFVRKNGIEAFNKLIDSSKTLFNYKLDALKERHNYREPEGRSAIANDMLSTIARVKNAILKADYIKSLAQDLDINEEALMVELKNVKDYKSASEAFSSPSKKPLNINPTEKLLIKLMLDEADLVERLRDNLTPADFQDERTMRIVSIIYEAFSQGKSVNPSSLVNLFISQQDLSQIICELSLLPDISGADKDKVVDDCIRRIKNQGVKMKTELLRREIKIAQERKDEIRLKGLMQEYCSLTKRGGT
ncbi:MAG: DNA primase [Candidatus Omnitrophota bacterium]